MYDVFCPYNQDLARKKRNMAACSREKQKETLSSKEHYNPLDSSEIWRQFYYGTTK